jgi:hypothetical protein
MRASFLLLQFSSSPMTSSYCVLSDFPGLTIREVYRSLPVNQEHIIFIYNTILYYYLCTELHSERSCPNVVYVTDSNRDMSDDYSTAVFTDNPIQTTSGSRQSN